MKDFILTEHWLEFIHGNIHVQCKNDVDKMYFLKICERQNIKWQSGNKATEFLYSGDAICCVNGYENNRVLNCDTERNSDYLFKR